VIEPETTPQPRAAVIGDNQPPGPVETLVAAQREAQAPRKERLDYILEKALAKAVTDRETAGQAGDIIKIAGEFIEIVDDDRKARTKPYHDASAAGKAACDEFLEPLRDAVAKLKERINEWDAAEDARILAQQREQEAFFRTADPTTAGVERTKAPGDVPKPGPDLRPAKRSRIVGDLGARVHQVEEKTYTVTDVRAVPDVILNSPVVHAAICIVARQMARHMPKIPGIEVTTNKTTQVR
jgi:hypothetical protein